MGERPLGWYCRSGPGVNTRRLLVEEGGFLYDSDAYDDELPYWTRVEGKPHLIVPYTMSTNDSKFGRGVFATGDDFFHYCRDAFDFLYREGATQPKMLSIGLHMRIIGHPARAAGLERLLDHIGRHAGVWVTPPIGYRPVTGPPTFPRLRPEHGGRTDGRHAPGRRLRIKYALLRDERIESPLKPEHPLVVTAG